MDAKNVQNFATPKIANNIKRLGMKRSSTLLTDNASSITPPASERALKTKGFQGTPQSDAKINYNTSAPLTPYADHAECRDIIRRTSSAGCRPFRLSLNKKLGAKMTKKKLQFHAANEEKPKSDEGNWDKNGTIASGDSEGDAGSNCVASLSNSSLISHIVDMKDELEARQRHADRIAKLKRDIEAWKIGFSTALNDFRKQLQPKLNTETTLRKLNIDQQMIKYVDD